MYVNLKEILIVPGMLSGPGMGFEQIFDSLFTLHSTHNGHGIDLDLMACVASCNIRHMQTCPGFVPRPVPCRTQFRLVPLFFFFPSASKGGRWGEFAPYLTQRPSSTFPFVRRRSRTDLLESLLHHQPSIAPLRIIRQVYNPLWKCPPRRACPSPAVIRGSPPHRLDPTLVARPRYLFHFRRQLGCHWRQDVVRRYEVAARADEQRVVLDDLPQAPHAPIACPVRRRGAGEGGVRGYAGEEDEGFLEVWRVAPRRRRRRDI